MKENLKDIPGYEGLYAVTEDGRVWGYPKNWRNKTGKFLVLNRLWTGYLSCCLWKNSRAKRFTVHRLMLLTYLDNSESKNEINHKNGIRDDNRLDNLEWCTRIENRLHAAYTLGKWVKSVKRYSIEGIYIDEFPSVQVASIKLGIDMSGIAKVCRGYRQKTAGGFKWKYA